MYNEQTENEFRFQLEISNENCRSGFVEGGVE